MARESINRREFIISSSLLLAGSVLYAACGAENQPQVENSATPTVRIATATLEPTDPPATATEVPTQTTTAIPEATPITEIPFDPNQRVPVIEHHNPTYGVNGNEYAPAYMTLAVYEEQLRTISELGLYTPTETEILGWLEGRHGLPANSLIIRIDLGIAHRDYEDAFRLLRQYGLRAICFLMPRNIPEVSDEHKVGWDIIREYMADGTLIPGSHGISHPHYSQITREEAIDDAVTAKEEIEAKLGRPCNFFAFPYDEGAHEDALLPYFRMLFGAYENYANAGSPLVGTFYPYIRGGDFDWERFRTQITGNE